MKLYAVTMPNGDKYGVPAELIAKSYADCYASQGEEWQDNYDAMLHWFNTGDYAFADWAKNNMSWDEVKQDAMLIGVDQPEVDFQEGWVNGEYEYIDMPEAPEEQDT